MSDMRRHRRPSARAFTLVELLVVIGIIALLIAILMPSLAKARITANTIKCQSNMRQVGIFLIAYANDNNGWMYPVGAIGSDGQPTHYGTNVDISLRWPVFVFKPAVPNPPAMICPMDTDLGAQDSQDPNNPTGNPWLNKHSYILNKHLAYEDVKYNRTHHISPSDIVVMGEKKQEYFDYYMEINNYGTPAAQSDYDRLVELYRHGLTLGSNLLFLDGHVEHRVLATQPGGIDPWHIVLTKSATQPTVP